MSPETPIGTYAERQPPRNPAAWALQIGALCGLALLLAAQILGSLNWRMEHDTPILHYSALLMDKYGLVPYRDFFETSMPGTFAIHYLIGHFVGYGDLAFRLVDIGVLIVLLVAAYLFMSRFGRWVAAWGSVVFGSVYLSFGQTMSLQRDYVGIIPIAIALLLLPRDRGTPVGYWRFAGVGLLFGLSVLIKPHLAIALPVVLGALLVFRARANEHDEVGSVNLIGPGVVTGICFLIPSLTAGTWLAANHALGPFLSILVKALPLYSATDGSYQTISGLHRAVYLIEGITALGGFGPLVLAALFGFYRTAVDRDENWASEVSLVALMLCTLAYAVYPALAGKFWEYHYMPLAYFVSMSAGLCLYRWPPTTDRKSMQFVLTLLPVLFLLVAIAVQPNLRVYVRTAAAALSSGPEAHAPKGGRVDEMAGWLEERLRPGDTVQPLDSTGGSIHALLLAKAELATRFMYDYQFYHHVSSPYTQELRKSFVEELKQAPPRFILDVEAEKPWPSGPDTTRLFPEFQTFLSSHYAVAKRGNGYLIYERIDP